ncbi:hypothetical protein [Mesorhizobium sp. M0633]|uniref:hypothetical protein n=1 Tax=Mesorhizobium sp. M0633 TaxID=2956977 RepID=UPI003337682F
MLGWAEPILTHGGRAIGEYSEAFVAFDVAKKKHAVAIAEGGRTGEVRFVGEVENSPAAIERTIKKLEKKYDRLHVCFEAGPTGYGLCRQVLRRGNQRESAASIRQDENAGGLERREGVARLEFQSAGRTFLSGLSSGDHGRPVCGGFSYWGGITLCPAAT